MTDLHFKSHQAPTFGAMSAKQRRELPTCAILIPTYGRVDRLHGVVANARECTPNGRVYLLMEPDEACQIAGAATLTTREGFGSYGAAVKYGLDNTEEPLIFTGSDDLRFTPGWLEACQRALDNGYQVVGTNDLHNPFVLQGRHATHSLIVRDYLEHMGGCVDGGPGSIFGPYHHAYVDSELVETAQARGVFAPCLEAVVEHLHPAFQNRAEDATTRLTQTHWWTDYNLFLKRRPLWETELLDVLEYPAPTVPA